LTIGQLIKELSKYNSDIKVWLEEEFSEYEATEVIHTDESGLMAERVLIK
jgi:hypothetical protein